MRKKINTYIILLFIIPIIITIMIAVSNFNKNYNYDIKINDNIDNVDKTGSLYIPEYNKNSAEYQIKSSSNYIYLSIFGLITMFGLTYIFIQKKD